VVLEKEYIMRCSSAEWIARNGCALRWCHRGIGRYKLRKLWDFLNELRSSLCKRRLEKTVLRPALLPSKLRSLFSFSLRYDVTQWNRSVKLRVNRAVYKNFSLASPVRWMWCTSVRVHNSLQCLSSTLWSGIKGNPTVKVPLHQ